MAYTEEQKAEALRIAAEVDTWEEASQRTGVPAATIRRWSDAPTDVSGTEDVAPSGGAGRSDTPPAPAKKKSSGGKGRKPKKGDLQALLSSSAPILMIVDPSGYDAQVILEDSERVAQALVDLADQNESVRKALMALMTTSAWAAVATTIAPMAVAILANHGMLPAHMPTYFGKPTPPGADKPAGGQSNGPPADRPAATAAAHDLVDEQRRAAEQEHGQP